MNNLYSTTCNTPGIEPCGDLLQADPKAEAEVSGTLATRAGCCVVELSARMKSIDNETWVSRGVSGESVVHSGPMWRVGAMERAGRGARLA